MRFLFIDPSQLSGDTVRFTTEQSHYLFRVLRKRPGDPLELVIRNTGLGCTVEVRDGQTARVADSRPLPAQPGPAVDLYLSSLKSDRLEWALQKSVELGADSLCVLAARHSVKLPGRGLPSRFESIAEAACQQSGRVHLPRLGGPETVEAALRQCVSAGRHVVMLHLAPGLPALRELAPPEGAAIACFIGPEGGFSDAECDAARQSRACLARLEGNVLRAETAAVAAVALLLAKARRL